MKEIEFWQIIDNLNWTQSKDYEQQKLFLLKNYSKETIDEFVKWMFKFDSQIFHELENFHENKIRNNQEGISIGDDSFGDLCSEIVGRGEHFFYKVMSNPEIAQEMAQNNDYTEKFSYCIPSDDEFRWLEEDFYTTQILAYLNEIETAHNIINFDKTNLIAELIYYEYKSFLKDILHNKTKLNDNKLLLQKKHLDYHLTIDGYKGKTVALSSYIRRFKRFDNLIKQYNYLFGK